MKEYYRIMLGAKSIYAAECFQNNFIGADFIGDIDLTGKLPENWRNFNTEFIPVWLSQNPNKTKVAAGLACGMLWTVAKGLKKAMSFSVRMAKAAITSAKLRAITNFTKAQIFRISVRFIGITKPSNAPK